ncbi:hypothetical protein [Frankia sp. EAN1pec]|uniref:hypothetical protein n=1 Tax=Parafrankia sp. (strain EAN1pec) TaxID=298653 RepID=UPI0000542E18
MADPTERSSTYPGPTSPTGTTSRPGLTNLAGPTRPAANTAREGAGTRPGPRLDLLPELTAWFAATAAEHDRTGTFPTANIQALHATRTSRRRPTG